MKLDFFRICQESLTNIMYHAQAKNVKITVEETDGKICLSIVDDGKGFCPEELNHISGLTSMRERASSINGQLKIESEIGKGTRISITIARHMNERESGLFIK
jgi:two-component system sensor histidine kinase DegS